MPTMPKSMKLNASSVDILNAIRNNASVNYRDYVPVARQSLDSVREIGSILMDYEALRNEFVSALVNRIGAVLLESKSYTNPWSVFKRGRLEFGETVEVIFTNIGKAHNYDASVAENKVFQREIPDIRTAFGSLNYQQFYKDTIQQEDLKQAFLSWDGVTSLIATIVDSMYTADQTDEFLTMKYMLARAILNGQLHAVEISDNDVRGTVSSIKGVSNKMTFQNSKYNRAGVITHTKKDDQYIIINSDFDAVMDVEVLAAAFNMEKAQFMGHRILVDGFGEFDDSRLAELFKNNPNYTPLTSDEKAALNAIPAVLVERSWFLIYDKLFQFTEQYNGEGMYWNYWLHDWKIFAISPFAQAALFVPGEPDVTSVTVTPAALTLIPGQSATLSVTVETDNFAPKAVDWESDTEGVTVDARGVVTVSPDFVQGETDTEVTITATSVYDSSVTGSATITIPAAT